jgi:hypothetical protein
MAKRLGTALKMLDYRQMAVRFGRVKRGEGIIVLRL